jgi:hypothetical protein
MIMKKMFVIIFILVFLVSGESYATHSNNGECGNGHLGASEDCSGSDGTTTYAAPAPIIGSGFSGAVLAVSILGSGIAIIRRRRKLHAPK